MSLKSDLKQSPETLLALYRISQIPSTVISIHEAYRIIMEQVQTLFSPSSASINLISPNNGLLEKEYALGYPPNIEDLALHIGKGITGRVAFRGESRYAPDVSTDNRYIKLIESTRSKMAAPMISGGQIIGVIDVDSESLDGFSAEQLEQLELITLESTSSLESVWRYRRLTTQSDQLSALLDVGQTVVSNLEIQSLWDSVTESALALTGSKLCTLQIFDKAEGEIELKSIAPDRPLWGKDVERLPPDSSISSSVVRTKRQVEFPNITTPDYKDLRDIPLDSDISSCLSTPMIYEGELVGIINIYTRNRHRFPNDEKRVLQAFASLSAVASENARLYARVFNSEARLRKSERLTTLGLLSAEIAHEIRNPLTVLKLLFGALRLNYPDSDPRHKDTQVIKEKINQLEEIVSKVLSFGKAPESLASRWSINDLIIDTCLLVRLKMQQQHIELSFQETEGQAFVNAHKGQLQQVFLNLIINAADAMPRGGGLTITPKIEQNAQGSQCVAVYFEDTGIGIPEDIQDKIFESFLTDKPEGTGLGLSIVKRILRSHHGDINVAATSPNGTNMRIELPLA
ncbi:MAG: GAF domain-containing protein [Symploca sp. SIO2D2]|nr:GAF domain-containing protein [Symploca sp. SIO2D2]